MATTVTGTRPLTKTGIGGGPKPRGPNGNGARKRNGHDSPFPDLQSSASRYRIGMWVAMAAILMMFTRARKHIGGDTWRDHDRPGCYPGSS